MTRRLPVVTASCVALLLAACGGGSDDASVITVDASSTTVATTTPGDDDLFEVVEPTDPADEEPVDTDPPEADPPATDLPTTDIVDTAPVTEPAPAESTPETPSTDPLTPAEPVDVPFTLEVDGLGVTSFGADPTGTISFVSSFLGEPTDDTGWVDPFTIGPCGGTELRQVSWNALRLEFGDSSSVTEGRQHFYAYTYGAERSLGVVTPAGIPTAEGISVGSSVADLLAAYPSAQLRSGDDFIAPNFFINDNLTGRMSGLADDDVVELIIGGIPCEG